MFKYSTQVITIKINNAAPAYIVSQESKLGTFFLLDLELQRLVD